MSTEVVTADAASVSPSAFRVRGSRFLILAVLAAGAVAFLVYKSMSGTTVYYLQVSELLNRSAAVQGQQVRVAGKVVPGSIRREGTVLRFSASDGTGAVPVQYDGVVPDIFKDDVEVVVEGRYSPAGGFQATTLLAKCPSKFESQPVAGSGIGSQ